MIFVNNMLMEHNLRTSNFMRPLILNISDVDFKNMDLDAMLDEAAEVHFKPAETAPTKKRVDPSEIKPFLAATALATPSLRDKWTSYVRRDYNLSNKIQFQPSKSYQSGDYGVNVPPTSNRILFEMVRSASTKCGISDAKTTKLTNLVNPATDNEVGKRLQNSYEKFLLESLKKEIESDINYDPSKFPSLAAVLAKM